MGCSPSSDESGYKEYVVPWNEQWRHATWTVRTPHQLIILDKPGRCDFCRIVRKVRKKAPYRCEKCKLNFALILKGIILGSGVHLHMMDFVAILDT